MKSPRARFEGRFPLFPVTLVFALMCLKFVKFEFQQCF